MKVQDEIMRAMARKLTWYEAAEIIGIRCRQMRRWMERWEEHGYDGLFDRRRGTPSPKRVPVATVQEVLRSLFFVLLLVVLESVAQQANVTTTIIWCQ